MLSGMGSFFLLMNCLKDFENIFQRFYPISCRLFGRGERGLVKHLINTRISCAHDIGFVAVANHKAFGGGGAVKLHGVLVDAFVRF